MSARALAGALALALAACGGGGGDAGGTPIAFATVEAASFSGITTATTAVVRSDAAWASLWAMHAAWRLPPPPAPTVDFTRDEVLALFVGGRPDGCHGVEILRVLDDGQRRTVVYAESVPGPGVMCAAVATAPVQMVRVSASPLPVVFQRASPAPA